MSFDTKANGCGEENAAANIGCAIQPVDTRAETAQQRIGLPLYD